MAANTPFSLYDMKLAQIVGKSVPYRNKIRTRGNASRDCRNWWFAVCFSCIVMRYAFSVEFQIGCGSDKAFSQMAENYLHRILIKITSETNLFNLIYNKSATHFMEHHFLVNLFVLLLAEQRGFFFRVSKCRFRAYSCWWYLIRIGLHVAP